MLYICITEIYANADVDFNLDIWEFFVCVMQLESYTFIFGLVLQPNNKPTLYRVYSKLFAAKLFRTRKCA